MNEQISSRAVDQRAVQILNDYQVPGLALSIVKDDALLFAKGYGLRALGSSHPVDVHTRFGIASITKSFTALALGMLVDEGRLNWSDPVTKHIPSFKLQDAFASREFTVRDLLVHRSGLAEIAGGTLWYGSNLSRDQVIAGLQHLKPISSFRSEFAYQNILYLVAGQIIPAVSGHSWDDFVQERIFLPLGMDNSSTSIEAHNKNDNIAQPHIEIAGELRTVALRSYDNVGPAASINTTAVDLAAYARLLLNQGQFAGQQLYSPQIARDLWTPQTLIPITGQSPSELAYFTPRYLHAYALGWRLQDIPRRSQVKISHSGGIDGLRSLLTLIPDENLGIVALANNEGPAPAIMTKRILDLYWGDNNDTWYDEVLSDYKQTLDKQKREMHKKRISGTAPSLSHSQYAGLFHSQLIGDIEIKLDQDQLTLQFPHTPSFSAQLSHWHYDTFHLNWQDPVVPDGLVTFILDSEGHATEIRLDQPNLLDVDFSEIHPLKRR